MMLLQFYLYLYLCPLPLPSACLSSLQFLSKLSISILFICSFLQVSYCGTQVYVAGYNRDGQLGFEYPFVQLEFTANPSLSGTVQIVASKHTLALFSDGSVYVCGYNNEAQLGQPTSISSLTNPTLLPNFNNVKNIYAGYYSSMIILNDGTVYVFGENDHGELGLGNFNNPISTPTLSPYLDGNIIKKISIAYHTLVLLNNGTVLSFGRNDNAQLGQGNFNGYSIPTLIPNLNNIIDICTGYRHSLFLLHNETVFSCGNNNYGQLGLGSNIRNSSIPIIIPNLNNVTGISCGDDFNYALLSNGSILSWGDNSNGQLGLGNSYNLSYIPTLIPGINNVTDLKTSSNHGFILLENGTIMGIGNNNYGQLGLGDSNNAHSFVPIPSLNNLSNILFNRTTFLEDSSFFIQQIPDEGTTNNSKGINLVEVIVIPIVLLIMILSILFILIFMYLKRKQSKPPKIIKSSELIKGSNRIYKGTYTGKEVALKKILNNDMNEYNFYKKIGLNPNIVEYFGIYEFNEEKYLILEILASSLSQYFRPTKNNAIEKLIKFIQQISICLSFLEEQKYIHGNICCDNILRKENDKLKLCDFQFTHTLYNPLTLSENDLSKIQFYGPEVKKNRRYDKKSDVWSWSVTCIQIFYLNQEENEKPFQMNEQNLSSKPSQCPNDLWNLIQKGLNSDPNLRPSFKDMEKDLGAIYKNLLIEIEKEKRKNEPNLPKDPNNGVSYLTTNDDLKVMSM